LKIIIAIFLFLISFSISSETLSIVEMQHNAERVLNENNIYNSIALFKDILEINPSYFNTHLGLSKAYFLLGEYHEASIYIKKAIFLNKNSIEARILYGRILTGSSDFKNARIIFQDILLEEKNNLDAILGTAELEVAEGNILAAIDIYESTIIKFPSNRKALISSIILFDSINKNIISRAYVDQVLFLYPEDSYVNFIAARHFYDQGENNTALVYASRSYDIAPGSIETAYLLSLIHISLGNFDTAIQLIEKSLEKERDNYALWYLLGELNIKLNNIDKALFCYATALNYGEQNELPRIALENVILKNKPINDPVRQKYAEYHFQNGIELSNKNFSIQARNEFRRGLQLDPHSIKGQLLYADITKTNGFFNKYLSILEKIVMEYPDNIELSDDVEIYSSIMTDTVSGNWNIDQFLIESPRFKIEVFYNKPSSSINFLNEGFYLGSFLIHSLHGYENIESNFNSIPSDFNTAYSISRKSGSDYFIIFDFLDTKRSFSMEARIYHSGTGSILMTIPVFKTGNQKIILSLHKLSRILSESLPDWGQIIDRKFNRVLLNSGNIHGTKTGDTFYIIRKEDLSLKKDEIGFNFDPALLLGEITVTETDDLVSEGILKKYNFFDLINTGDLLIKKTDSIIIPDIDEIRNQQELSVDLYKSIISIP